MNKYQLHDILVAIETNQDGCRDRLKATLGLRPAEADAMNDDPDAPIPYVITELGRRVALSYDDAQTLPPLLPEGA